MFSIDPNARSKHKISSHILFNSLSKTRHVFCATRQQCCKMREEDAHDDILMAMDTSNQIHARAHMRAAENAAKSHILETGDLNDNANSPLDVRNDTPAVLAANKALEAPHF